MSLYHLHLYLFSISIISICLCLSLSERERERDISFSIRVGPRFLNGEYSSGPQLLMCIGHLEGLLKHRLLGPTSSVSDSGSRGRTPESALLASSQLRLLLMVWGAPLRTAGVEIPPDFHPQRKKPLP